MQFVQWFELRKLYGDEFWKEFAKLKPRGFDSRAQQFDRLAKGDDKLCMLAEYAGYLLQKEKGAPIEFVAPARRPAGRAASVRHRRQGAPSRSVAAVRRLADVAARAEPSADQPVSLLRLGPEGRAAMPGGRRLADYKLLPAQDLDACAAARPQFNKEWNAMLGL